MKKKLITLNSVIIILVLILCLSCKAQKKGSAEENAAFMDSVLTLVLCDNYGGSEIRGIQVIKNRKTLELAFAKINRTRKPGLPIPQLDFTKETAILTSRGEEMGSSQLKLKLYSETSEQLVFKAEEARDSLQCNNPAITTPFCLYKTPFTQKEFVFKDMAN